MKRRIFIKTTALGTAVLPGLKWGLDTDMFKDKISGNDTIKDKLWLWGHTAGVHHHAGSNLPGVNQMGPKEGCDFLGIEKCCRVAFGSAGPFPPFDKEAEKLKDLKEVVWSAIGDAGSKQHNNDQSDIDGILHIAEDYPNISGAILDDFFLASAEGEALARHSVRSIREMQDKLHNFNKRRLDFWIVWYTHQLNADIDDYLELFDVITLWTWKPGDLINLDSNLEKCVERTVGKRHLAGCYMWNWNEAKPLPMDLMKYQLDTYYHWLKDGKIDGVVFCANTIVDLGLEAVDYARNWIAEVGNEKISL